MTVPGLKVDGQRVQGTRYIARFLDEIEPARPLFPADPELRAKVEEAERWGEQLQNSVRRIFYSIGRRDRSAFKRVMLAERALPMRVVLRAATPLIIRLATAKHDAVDAAAQDDLAALPAALDQIDAWIEEGVLGGSDLNAADFQIAANLAAVLLSEDGAPYVRGRPAEWLAGRVAPDYTGRVGRALPAGTIPAVLPPEWLPPLRPRAGERAPLVAPEPARFPPDGGHGT